MSVIANLVVKIGSQFDNRGLNDAQRQFGQTGNQMSSAAAGIQTAIGRAFAVGTVVEFGRRSVEAAVEFQSAFTGVIKTVDATDSQLAALEQGIREMARELPTSAVEIASVAEAAGQLGLRAEDVLAFSRVMIDLANASDIVGEQGARSIARFQKVTGEVGKDTDRLASVIVGLGNSMAATESEILDMATRLAGAGKQAGLTQGEIVALAASMTEVGIQAELGGTTMSRIMLEMQKAAIAGGESLETFARVVPDFAQVFRDDAAKAVQMFVENVGRLSDADAIAVLEGMGIEGSRVNDVVLRLANSGDSLSTSLKRQATLWKENNALTEEAARRYATAESEFKKFKNQLTDIGITLGNVVLPGLVKTTQAATNFFDVIRSFDDGSRSFIASLNKYGESLRDIGVLNDIAYTSLLNLTGVLSIFSGDTQKAAGSTDILIDKVGDVDGVTKGWIDTLTKGNKEIVTTGNVIKPTAEELEKAAERAEKFADAVKQSAATLPAFAKNMREVEQPTGEAAAKLKLIEESLEAAARAADKATAKMRTGFAAMTPPLREVQVEMGKVEKGAKEMGEAVKQSFGQKLIGEFSNILAQVGMDFESLSVTMFGQNGAMANQVAAFFGLGGPWGLAIAGAAEIMGVEMEKSFQIAANALKDILSKVGGAIGGILGIGGGSGGGGFAKFMQDLINQNSKIAGHFITMISTEVTSAFSKMKMEADALGQDFDSAATWADLWEQAIRDWIAAGGESGAVLDFLIAAHRSAQRAMEDAERSTRTFVDGIRNIGDAVRHATGIIRDSGIGFGGGGPSRSREGTGLGGITPGAGVETVLQHIMGIVEQEFMRLGELASAYSQMGVDFDLAGEQAGFLKRMIAELAVEHGTNSEVVQALIKQYNELTKGQKELTDEEVEQMRLEKERIRIQEDLNERIARANAELAVTGDEADHTRDTISALTEALIQLEQAGLGSSDLFADLMKQLKELEGAVKDTDLTPPGSGDGGGGSTTIQGDLNIEFPDDLVVSISGGEVTAMIEGGQFDDITGLLEEIKAAILFASDLPGNLEQKLEDFRVAFDSATDGVPGMTGPTTGSLMPALSTPAATALSVPGAAQMGGSQASGGMAAPVVNLTALLEVDGERLMVPITKLMRGA